ncbi:LptF/LptG family permease [bacterium]
MRMFIEYFLNLSPSAIALHALALLAVVIILGRLNLLPVRVFGRLDRYLISEFLLYLVFGLTLVIIFLMVNAILFQMLEFVIEKQVPFGVFMKILFFQLPAYAVLALPMATLFATLIAISRMSKDSEVDVMRTSGISVFRIMLPMLFAGALVSGFDWVMLQKIVPWSNNQSASLWRQFYLSDVMSKPQANIFFKGKDDKTFYIKSYEPRTDSVHGVLIYDTQTGTYPRITSAPRGIWKGKELVIFDGLIHHFKNNGYLDYEVDFKSITINVERHMEEIFGEQKTPQEMTLGELKDKIQLFRESGIDTKKWETDMHFKMSIPVACFILVMMGVPLSLSTGRSGMMAGIVTAVLLVIVYWVCTILTTTLGYKGIVPPVIAAWSQNVVFLAVGLLLMFIKRR